MINNNFWNSHNQNQIKETNILHFETNPISQCSIDTDSSSLLSSDCINFLLETLSNEGEFTQSISPQDSEKATSPTTNVGTISKGNVSFPTDLFTPAPFDPSILGLPCNISSNTKQTLPKISSSNQLRAGKMIASNWKVEEDAKLFDLHEMRGNNWAYIASQLPGRSRIDVKTRFRSIHRAAKRFWTTKMDELLLAEFRNSGYNWNDEIAMQFPNRTKSSVKNRLKDLLEMKNIKDYPIGSPNIFLSSKEHVVKSLSNYKCPSRTSQCSDHDGSDDDHDHGHDNDDDEAIQLGNKQLTTRPTIPKYQQEQSTPGVVSSYLAGPNMYNSLISPNRSKVSLVPVAVNTSTSLNQMKEPARTKRERETSSKIDLDQNRISKQQYKGTSKLNQVVNDASSPTLGYLNQRNRSSVQILLTDSEVEALMMPL